MVASCKSLLQHAPSSAFVPAIPSRFDRTIHIAYTAQDDATPTHYICGEPVRQLIARTAASSVPYGGPVCPVCAELDLAGLRLRRV